MLLICRYAIIIFATLKNCINKTQKKSFMKIPIIAYVHIARITASLFSIAGGYVYTVNTVGLITNNNPLKHIIASTLLVLLEVGGVMFLAKSIKDVLLKKRQVYIYIIPAIAFMSLSFILTTNGAVMWLKEKSDKQESLINSYKNEIDKNVFIYEKAIKKNKAIYDSIANEKLNKWKTARELQIAKLQFYASEIARLEKNKTENRNSKLQNLQTAISDNKVAIKHNSKKYYWLAVIIMLSVLYFNFLLVWLKNKKSKQKKIDYDIKKVPNIDQTIINTPTDIKTRILELAGTMKQKDIAEKLGVHPSKVSRTISKFSN